MSSVVNFTKKACRLVRSGNRSREGIPRPFDFVECRGLLARIRTNSLSSRSWADLPTSLNLAEVQKTIGPSDALTFADIAAYTLAKVDKVLSQTGKPVGIIHIHDLLRLGIV